MTAQWIREHYGVPAKKGGRIRYTYTTGETKDGTIIGYMNNHLIVRLDGASINTMLHPTWRIEYL